MSPSKALTLIAVTFCCVFSAHAQDARKRQATVLTADDKKYEGAFVKADDAGVTLESGDVQTTVKLDTVKSITFGDIAAPPAPAPTPDGTKSKEATQNAITALRKLKSATGVGVTFADYGRFVIEAKAVVDEQLPKMDWSPAKFDIERAMNEYAYASQIWNYYNQYSRGSLPTKKDPAHSLIIKYNIPIKISVWTELDRGSALSAIWQRAGQFFNHAVEQTAEK